MLQPNNACRKHPNTFYQPEKEKIFNTKAMVRQPAKDMPQCKKLKSKTKKQTEVASGLY